MRNPQAAFILLALGSIACTSDVLRETYPTAEAARAAGLFARGWVPDVLPPGSGPIIEVHNLDTNQHCSRSQVPPLAVPEVVAALETGRIRPLFRIGIRSASESVPLRIVRHRGRHQLVPPKQECGPGGGVRGRPS